AGKSTTIGKMAKFYQKSGLRVGVICGDIHRPAAFEQLKQLSEQVKCEFYGNKGKKADEIAIEGLHKLKHCDVVIFDSAGRSGFDAELAHELKAVVEKFKPTDTFLVVSADIGQVAGKQAEEFSKAATISGVIITKMDGSGKGGGALSSVHASKSKVAFIGTGEKMDALEVFDSKKFVANLVGFPDLETLIEKVKEASDEKAMEKVMETGKLDYESFMAQMRAMKKMGPMKQILQMIGVYDVPEEMMAKSEEKLKVFENAVNSMSKKERGEPELMNNRSRQERVAKGAGIKPEDVKELVKQFNMISKMMTGAKKNKGLLKRFAGKMPGGFDLSKLSGLGA
ncbi:MAG: signal recognition particle protein Srp19, partial [Candidatus Micrarchaeota archaeon]|nr:signal recognition particle protein Srp19 [Candidatus Micrarchaeota archaeon]